MNTTQSDALVFFGAKVFSHQDYLEDNRRIFDPYTSSYIPVYEYNSKT